MIYEWKPGSRPPKVDAQVVGERLQYLRDKHGQLTARIVLDDAKGKRSPLHKAFDWDPEAAIENWLLTQAQRLLRIVVAVPEDQPERTPIRAFVVVNELGEDNYIGSYVALSDDQLRQQVLQRALRELRQFQAKYQELNELAKVFAALDELTEAA